MRIDNHSTNREQVFFNRYSSSSNGSMYIYTRLCARVNFDIARARKILMRNVNEKINWRVEDEFQ